MGRGGLGLSANSFKTCRGTSPATLASWLGSPTPGHKGQTQKQSKNWEVPLLVGGWEVSHGLQGEKARALKNPKVNLLDPSSFAPSMHCLLNRVYLKVFLQVAMLNF